MANELILDWGEAFGNESSPKPLGATDAAAALMQSLRDRACVDMPYIAELMHATPDEAIERLGESVYLDPATGEWVTSDEYLSGNLRLKLAEAVAADRATGAYGRNIAALRAALPPKVSAGGIYVTIGSPWVPADVIEDFICHIMADTTCHCKVLHDAATGSWTIQSKGAYRHRVESRQIWGTKRMLALDIVEGLLNGKDARVTDEVSCPENQSGVKHVVNHSETAVALEKQRLITEEFSSWIWQDPERTRRLVDMYNEKYCSFQGRRFNGGFLTFPGMAGGIELRAHQKNGVMRIVSSKSVLLAHDVGSGKTYTCIAACMELKRLGLSEKTLCVVPNNVVGQWASLFEEMYPQARVIVVSPREFKKDRRQGVLAQIRDGDYDAVVMAYSCFDRIPLSKEFALDMLDSRIGELTDAMRDPQRRTSAVKRARKASIKQREKLEADSTPEAYSGIHFDELGITQLFVDEAHNYKNLPLGSRRLRVMGLNAAGSAKCKHLLEAVRCVQRTGRGGVVFATGTVLTNSIADCYAMQLYLQPGTLNLLDLQSFESWVGMFAQRRTEWEIDVDTSNYRLATRFGRFGNLDELSAILANVADFYHLGPDDDIPDCDGRIDVLVGKSSHLDSYLHDISKRAERVRHGLTRSTEDNLLKICTDGRRAAIDVRLVVEDAPFDRDCKALACASNIHRIWERTADAKSTQLVFCDTSTPKSDFNIYGELKRLLVALGVPEGEVAFVHDAKTGAARDRLFAAVRSGEVRVLVGSTFKLGLGVNVQDRLVAAHHLDTPWRPADMTQREGRILRQGNANEAVEIYRYVTEGSFDAYSWQILENKQRAIDELLSGTYEGRFLESDIGDAALSYGEIKALAVNNPLLKKRVEVANELQRLLILQRREGIDHADMHQEIDLITSQISRLEREEAACREDAAFHKARGKAAFSAKMKADMRSFIFQAIARNAHRRIETQLPKYRGFAIVLPAGMEPDEPYLFLVRDNRYKVGLGEGKELGILVRMDNVLDSIGKRADELAERIAELYRSWQALEDELASEPGCRAGEIEECKARLARIDMELEEARE